MGAREDHRSIALTPRGIGTLIAGLLFSIGAVVIRVSELYLVAGAASLVPLLGWLRVRWLAKRIDLDADVSVHPRRPEVGRPVQVRIQVRPRRRMTPSFEIGIDAAFLDGAQPMLVPTLLRAGDVVELDGTALRRGRFAVGPARVGVVDGFGFARATWLVGAAREILVLPAFAPVHVMPTLPPDESAQGRGRRSPQRGSEFHALRQYQRGDDLRQVHWRATARHGALLIRELEPLSMPRLTVVLDDRASSHPDDATLESSISLAASIIAGAGARGFGVRLITTDGRLTRAAHGRSANELLIERLAVTQRTGATSLEAAAAAVAATGRGGALVAILGSRCDDASAQMLATLRRRVGWAGAALVGPGPERVRAQLIAGGWNVIGVRPNHDRIEAVWKAMLGRPAGRPSPSSRS